MMAWMLSSLKINLSYVLWICNPNNILDRMIDVILRPLWWHSNLKCSVTVSILSSVTSVPSISSTAAEVLPLLKHVVHSLYSPSSIYTKKRSDAKGTYPGVNKHHEKSLQWSTTTCWLERSACKAEAMGLILIRFSQTKTQMVTVCGP